jgi:hypothetical protein
MPSPPSLGGAGLAEVAQAVRFPGRRVHLALRRYSERPSIDRLALDCRQSSFRRVTRVSPRHSFSVFSPCSALSACSCSLALSGPGKPLTLGSPLNPTHLRWGCCMNYCGAPDAGGSRLPGRAGGYPPGPPTDPYVRNSRIRFLKQSHCCPCKESLLHSPLACRGQGW